MNSLRAANMAFKLPTRFSLLPPAFCPELELDHICDQIALIEEKAMDLEKDLQRRISSRMAVEHRCRVFESKMNSNQLADVGRARDPALEVTNENTRPTQGSSPSGRQNSPQPAPMVGEGSSGDGSILRIEASNAAELNRLLQRSRSGSTERRTVCWCLP